MKVYEVILPGFDGSTDDTDDYVNGYFTLDFYTPDGDVVGGEEVTKVILPCLQDRSYVISMGSQEVHRLEDFKLMYTFELSPEEVDYHFE